MKLTKSRIQDRCLKGLARRLEGRALAMALAASGVVVGESIRGMR